MCNCSCANVSNVTYDASSLTDRADLGMAPGLMTTSAVLCGAVTCLGVGVVYSRRLTAAVVKASPGLSYAVGLFCVLTIGASLLWVEDDITVTGYFDGDDLLMTCSISQLAKKATQVDREGCGSCTIRVWLTVFAVTLMWGSVWLKLLRSRSLCDAKRAGRSFARLAQSRVLMPLLLPLIGVQAIGLGLYSLVNPPALDHPEFDQRHYTTQARWVCFSPLGVVFWSGEGIVCGLFMAYMLKIAKGLQKLSRGSKIELSESVVEELGAYGQDGERLTFCTAIAIFGTLLIALLMGLNQDNPEMLACLRGFGLQLHAMLVFSCILGPLVFQCKKSEALLEAEEEEEEDGGDNESGEKELTSQVGLNVLPKSMQGTPLSEEMASVHQAVETGAKPFTGRKGLRQLVSTKKRRYQRDGYDLDLTYITDQLIALGFPAEGKEATWRNPMSDVKSFLEAKHRGHYRVYNLCSESNRQYDPKHFGGRVANFGFEDHKAPPLPMLLAVCQDINAWLQKDERNVCAIHCKAGKGRTGTVICAYLAYADQFEDIADVINYYGVCRTTNGKGVTIPSQLRYIRYFAQSMHAGSLPQDTVVCVTGIHLTTIPEFDPDGGCQPYFKVYRAAYDGTTYKLHPIFNSSQVLAVTYHKHEDAIHFPASSALSMELLLKGDVFVEFKSKGFAKKSTTMCGFWLNTAFLETPEERLLLRRHEVDGSHKDKKCKHFKEGFQIEVTFRPVTEADKQRAEGVVAAPQSDGQGVGPRKSIQDGQGVGPSFEVDGVNPSYDLL